MQYNMWIGNDKQYNSKLFAIIIYYTLISNIRIVLILSLYCQNYISIPTKGCLIALHIIIKGIKNGCPCIVEIRGTQGCALVGDPTRAVGECRDVAKAQP